MDVLKIDKGICRHTADFTPPANEDVDNDEYTVLLLKMNGTIAGGWKSVGKLYTSHEGNATLESVGSDTWNDLAAEDWTLQRRSWRKVV
jgi:hypothetical protein